jgi:POTRA domain-containing FtsQ-type protein
VSDLLQHPRVDPRFVQRWVDVRRAAGRRRLRIVIAAVALSVLCLLAFGSLYTPLFRVRHVRVKISGATPAAGVVDLAGLNHQELMIHINTAALVRRLDADPWLGDARASKHWPGTVDLWVSVRTPLANVARPGGGWVSVDATGRVLQSLAAPAPGLPLLQGVASVPAPGGWIPGAVGPAAVMGTKAAAVNMNASADSTTIPTPPAAALAVLASLPARVRSEVVSITAGQSGLSMAVEPANVATGSVVIHFGDESQLAAKVDALDAVLTETNLANVVSIDLTVPDRPAVLTAR